MAILALLKSKISPLSKKRTPSINLKMAIVVSGQTCQAYKITKITVAIEIIFPRTIEFLRTNRFVDISVQDNNYMPTFANILLKFSD